MHAETKHAISVVVIVVVAVLSALRLHAQDNCNLPLLQGQRKDARTVRRLEDQWSVAFLQGDADFMRCLLIPGFTEITRSGALKFLRDELDMAAKNRGRNIAVPQLPKTDVLMYENVAVAYALSAIPGPDGKPHPRRNADVYIWNRGQWHVVFSEQTPIARP